MCFKPNKTFLIGFKISPCLWKHIDTHVIGLSAGRVQSSLLNMILEKEEELDNYEGDIILDIHGSFKNIEKRGYIILSDTIRLNNLNPKFETLNE